MKGGWFPLRGYESCRQPTVQFKIEMADPIPELFPLQCLQSDALLISEFIFVQWTIKSPSISHYISKQWAIPSFNNESSRIQTMSNQTISKQWVITSSTMSHHISNNEPQDLQTMSHQISRQWAITSLNNEQHISKQWNNTYPNNELLLLQPIRHHISK